MYSIPHGGVLDPNRGWTQRTRSRGRVHNRPWGSSSPTTKATTSSKCTPQVRCAPPRSQALLMRFLVRVVPRCFSGISSSTLTHPAPGGLQTRTRPTCSSPPCSSRPTPETGCQVAVGETVILMTPPCLSMLNHLAKVQGGAIRMTVSPTAATRLVRRAECDRRVRLR